MDQEGPDCQNPHNIAGILYGRAAFRRSMGLLRSRFSRKWKSEGRASGSRKIKHPYFMRFEALFSDPKIKAHLAHGGGAVVFLIQNSRSTRGAGTLDGANGDAWHQFSSTPRLDTVPRPRFFETRRHPSAAQKSKIPGTNIRAALFSSLNGLPTRSFFRTPPRKFQIKTSDQKSMQLHPADGSSRMKQNGRKRPRANFGNGHTRRSFSSSSAAAVGGYVREAR